MRHSRRLVAVLVTCMVVASCGARDVGVTATQSDEASTGTVPTTVDPVGPVLTTPEDTTDSGGTSTSTPTPLEDLGPPPGGGIVDFGDAKTPEPYDNFVNRAFVDITNYWTEQYPIVYGGKPFVPITGIYALYPARTDNPSCDGPVTYKDIEGNASFVDCGDGTDVIMYDDAELVPQLVQQFGAVAVSVVAAHEYGHAIGKRAGVFDLGLKTIDLEQQADCFAGSWVAHVASGGSDLLQFTDADVKGAIAAMIYIRDPVGIDSANDSSGHGTAFDRVGAFQDGFDNGPSRCAEYPTKPNPRIDLPFLTQEDVNSGGNLPYADIQTELPTSLDTFWQPTLDAAEIPFTPPTLAPFDHDGPYPTCDGRSPAQLANDATYCLDTNTIAYDSEYLKLLYDNYGDLSFGYPIAAAYSDAVQTALQFPLAGEPRVLLDDCLVGAWLRDIVPNGVNADNEVVATNPAQTILLSAGDLDEVVSTAVLEGDETSSTNIRGTAFEKIDAFRAGVLGSLPACQALT